MLGGRTVGTNEESEEAKCLVGCLGFGDGRHIQAGVDGRSNVSKRHALFGDRVVPGATVGTTPMEYLTRWRMLLAGDRLTNSGDPIYTIARSLG